MASDINEISDVEDFIRQTGMDSSDTGGKIVDYFKNKRAALQSRGRLYDGSDNPINFRLDNLQPVQLPQTSSNLPSESSPVRSTNATEAASTALVKPLSELSLVLNRLPSFVSPGGVAATSPVKIAQKPRTNVITSPSGRSTAHVSPMVSNNPNLLSAPPSLQKQLLLQQYKRKNQMKCEAIRNASQLASSTPVAGESSERRGDNLLDLRETISPIHEDQEHGTPQRVLRSPKVARERVVPGSPTTYARSINTPVPATQDVPDGADQNCRENTPPRNDCPVIVPETPSPVRRSPRIPRTPLSGLSLQHRPNLYNASLAKSMSGQDMTMASDVRSSPCTPSRRSILKSSERSFCSVKNRVSFSEKLIAVRLLTPVASSDDSEITSDESEEQETENGEPRRKKILRSGMQRSNGITKLLQSRFVSDVEREQVSSDPSPDNATTLGENNKDNKSNQNNPTMELTPHPEVEVSVRNDERNVRPSRRSFGNRRSNGIDCIDEPLATLSDANKRCTNRTNGNAINMILDDWNEPTSDDMEVDVPNENRSPRIANQTISQSLAITNIDTPRTVMMDIFDPPSAFCDNSQQGDRHSPRKGLLAVQMNSEGPRSDETDSSRKRKQNNISRRLSFDENEPDVALRPKISMLAKCVAPAERIVSVDSPNDHVPLNMIEVVDMIHSRANSDLMVSESENDRRTTLNMPTKRRHTKLKVDAKTEMYLKSDQTAGSQDKENPKKRENRRKLFAQELSEGQDGKSDEPQPLPLTQDNADTAQQEQEAQYGIKPLSVLVKRLSVATLTMDTQSTPVQRNAEIDEQCEKPVDSPIKEKQNEEQNEKGDRPKIAHGKTPSVGDSEHPPLEAKKTARQKPKQQKLNNKKKRTHKMDDMDEPDLMMGKYLKNVSNEIRHQIESEGPRRSHRNRRLAAEVLRNNPDISRHGAPQYVMPTIKEVLKYCQLSNVATTSGKAKKKSKSSNATNKKKDVVSQKVVVPLTTSSEEKKTENKRGRGRPKNHVTAKENFDNDGFRIPPVPYDEIPGPSSKAAYKTTDQSTETNCSSTSGLPQGVSLDSGLSSAAMTSDDATEVPQAQQPSSSKASSKPKKKTIQHPAPSCSSASPPAPNEILAEKRKTLDWMMMLMETRQNRPVALPMVEIQGFTHLSLEHLVFQEREGIEYSFYVYSNGDNFGFLRFPPKTEKKTTRTKRCSLKFLILNGSLKFIINENVVNVVGGDFLMIPIRTSYRIVNGPETTLMFMIKTGASTNTNQTTCENGD